jgi:hypothetical protein
MVDEVGRVFPLLHCCRDVAKDWYAGPIAYIPESAARFRAAWHRRGENWPDLCAAWFWRISGVAGRIALNED